MSTIPKTSYQSVEALTRWVSRVPDFTVTGTVPANAATNVPVNQTISISFPIAIDATTANSTNITMSHSVGRTTSLHSNGSTVIIDPTGNLANNTLHTVTVTTAVRGLFGDAKVPFPTPFVFSFTTAP
jgi:Bacterial Ig-like domain